MPNAAITGIKPGALAKGQKPPKDVFQRMNQKSLGRSNEITTVSKPMKQPKVSVKRKATKRTTPNQGMKQGGK